MEARVDTGASLSAIPVSLMESLRLPSVRKVKIRTGIDDTERRDVVRVEICIAGRVFEVEASVRRGHKLGRIPLLGRNFLAMDNFLVSVETEDIAPPLLMPDYIDWLDQFIAHGSHNSPALADSPELAGPSARPRRESHLAPRSHSPSQPWWRCCCCARPPARGASGSQVAALLDDDRDSADNDRVVHIIDHVVTPPDSPGATLRLPASRYPDVAVDSILILEEMVDVAFQNPSRVSDPVPMAVRVDTGASLTAVPVAVQRSLDLPPIDRVRVRLGNDRVDVRDVCQVEVVLHGTPFEVRSSVRHGHKLGKTAILGRNLLASIHALVRVADPKRKSIPKDKSKAKSKSKATKSKATKATKSKATKAKSKSKATKSKATKSKAKSKAKLKAHNSTR